MEVHHIGYAVKSILMARKEFERFGYVAEGETILDEERRIYVQFMKNQSIRIELIMPADNDSPIDNILKSNGSCVYHTCYETDDFDKVIVELTKNKYKIIHKPQRACAIGNHEVVFLYNSQIGLVEILKK